MRLELKAWVFGEMAVGENLEGGRGRSDWRGMVANLVICFVSVFVFQFVRWRVGEGV